MLVTQLCPALSDPMDCSASGSSVQRFSRQGYWSGLPVPSPGDLPNPGIEPGSPELQADSLPTELKENQAKKKKCKKAKWLSEQTLQRAQKRREAKGKGKKERYTHLNAEF